MGLFNPSRGFPGITDLTNNTAQAADDTIANIAQLSNNPNLLGDAAARSELNGVLTVIEQNLSDLTEKVREILA